MKAIRNLLIYVFSTYLLVMFGFIAAQDFWCSTLVKGVIYGSYSVNEMFPKNFTNCTWTLENPDPTKYSIYLKFSKKDLSCSNFSLLAYQFDHYSHEKIRDLLKNNNSIVHLCDSQSTYVFLQYDKNFVQLRRVYPLELPGLIKKDGNQKSFLEFLVLNKVSPSQFGCQVLCTWLERCLKAENGEAESCVMVYVKCSCPQHLGADDQDLVVLNNVVLPLNEKTEGCLTQELQTAQVCNLSREAKRPPKEEFGMMGEHTIKSQRPRSVHERKVPQEQADAAKFMAQTGDSVAEEWSQWSTCSVTCGQGSQVRTRSCVSPYGTLCSGPLRESRVCNSTALCPVHGVWEEWSPWSLCSFTCGRGQRTRARTCVPPQYGGRACDGPETQQKNCNIALCPIDGHWQEWSSWSQCSATCSNGTQQRSRQCTAAAHGGSECRGPWAESRECYNPDCTANGQWNPWGHWSGCSKSCDGGWQRRIRVCQGAAVTGQQCEGVGEEVQKCSEQRCPAPYEICSEDYFMSMVWRRTLAGDMAFNRCPLNATGTTSRRCTLDLHGVAYWEHPSFARCISNEYRYLQHSIKEHLAKGQRTIAGEGMSQVTKTLLDLTQKGDFYAGDLLVSVEILRNVTDTFNRANYIPSSDNVQNFFQVVSNLLEEENKDKWQDAQQIYPGSVDLMQVIEDFIYIVGMGMMDFHNSYLMTGNLVASIQKLPAESVMTDINFPMKGRKGMVEWARNSEDKIVIPKNIFTSLSSDFDDPTVFVLGTVLYKTLGHILPPPRNYTVVNSKIIVLTIRPEPKIADSLLEIELAHLANGTSNPYCVLWDVSRTNESWGAWSTQGCKTVFTDASHTKCLCDRLSTFAILAHQPREINMDQSGMPSITLVVGCGLSCLALITLAVVYAVLWRYIRSERSIILINFCLSIISSNILILVGQTQTHNRGVCTMTTAFLHFFFLASFCWVLTEAWQSYMAVTGKIRTRLIRKRFLCLGWGLPALVVAISMGFTKAEGYGTAHYCWLSLEGGLLYAFVGPAAAVVLVNMVIGILVFNKLVSRDGILDKKLKHRTGQMSEPHSSLTLKCAKCGVVSTTALSATTASNAINFAFTTDFEKDVDIACRSALHKEMAPCRAATITGTLSRISLNDDEEEKGVNPEGMSYSTLPGNIISKVIIQPPSGLHMSMGLNELAEQCMKKDNNSELRRTVYLRTDDNLRAGDSDLMNPQDRMMESDYIVMPRGSANTQVSMKDDNKLNIGMETLPHERLIHYKVNPEFSMNPNVMDHINLNLDHHLATQEHMQSLPFEPQTAVKNFLSEMEENAGLSRSETGSTISMSSLERRKSRYSDLDFEKVMHTRKRHMELFQELNQKFQTLDRFRDIPNTGSMEKQTPNKHPWDSYNNPSEYQHYTTMNVLDTEANDALEMKPPEWEKCVSLPLDVQEGDFQTEV
nr:PREDICTED: adhesion G protein-coupled receptor B3 [Latimeria chalumnae]|eukprot:XP_006003090.1 PREDICTED: adhesion G protein-coupled receptor B3 [Latimeria chalumnae]